MNISNKIKDLKVGVIMGGTSKEREISLESGKAIFTALKKYGLKVEAIDVGDKPRPQIKKANPDICFIALHGAGGEDGKIQTVLESLKIPYTGADAKASKVAFNKWESRALFEKNKIPVTRGVLLTKKNYKSKLKNIRFPLFLKPLEEGSSIGIRLLNDRRTVESEINEGFKTYSKMILEDKVFGRELTVGIVGNAPLPIIELTTERPFFDYEAKYKKGNTKYFSELNMDEKEYKKYQRLALKVFKVLNMRDFARVDMIVDSWGNPYVLELNSIPGMTKSSLLPKAAEKIGVDFTHLCLKILDRAVRRMK